MSRHTVTSFVYTLTKYVLVVNELTFKIYFSRPPKQYSAPLKQLPASSSFSKAVHKWFLTEHLILKHIINILRRESKSKKAFINLKNKKKNKKGMGGRLANGCGIMAHGTNTAWHNSVSPWEQECTEVRDLRNAHPAKWPFSFSLKDKLRFFFLILALLKRNNYKFRMKNKQFNRFKSYNKFLDFLRHRNCASAVM